MVRDTKTLGELIERSRDISRSPEQLRAAALVRLRQHHHREPRHHARDHRARRRRFRADFRLEMIVSCRLALPKHKSASRPVGPTNGSGFGETNPQAGIAQLTERRSRKAEAGGLIPSASTMPA